MSITHLTEDDLVLHYYGEMAAAEEAATTAHLGACGACRASYAGLQRVLGVIDEAAIAPMEDLPPSFERTVWARLEPNLAPPRRGWFSSLLMPAPLALGGAITALVVVAFFTGRALSPTAPVSSPAAAGVAAERVGERILLADLGQHLDRSQMVLVEMVSADDAIAFAGERERAEELVADNRLYRLAAEQAGDAGLSNLLDEIERVLTEIAAAPDRTSSQDLADLRSRIESRDLLFKVRVVSSQVRERQQDAIRRKAGPRS